MSKRAFTLIELLIVVAIIAILAAIAVPNFLEAQVRSKVARAQADMRSIATALESYRVDNSGYIVAWGGTGWDPLSQRLVPLTTPIAYMTSVPPDPFPAQISDEEPDTFDYFDSESAVVTGWFSANDNLDPTLYGREWRLACAGPDLNQRWGLHPPYDASNGSVSVGDIWIVQGGGNGWPNPDD